MEQKLQSLPETWAKPQTWRVLEVPDDASIFDVPNDPNIGQWAVSKKHARSLLMFDVDYAELANIAEEYQKTRAKPVGLLAFNIISLHHSNHYGRSKLLK
jgi:hypothetical protein